MPECIKRKKLLITPLLILLSTVIVTMFMLSSSSHALIGVEEGDEPKGINLVSLDGDSVDVSEHFGENPVIILFWRLTKNNAFLNYSLDEILFLRDFYNNYNEELGLQIFAVYVPQEADGVSDEEMESLRSLVESQGIHFPVLIDKDFESFRTYGVIALPSTIMIGSKGEIDFIYSSFPLSARSIMAKNINKLLGIESKAKKSSEDDIEEEEEEDEEEKDGEEEEEGEEEASGPDRFYLYALQMFKKGLYEQSLSALIKSQKITPDYSWAHNLRGIILLKKGLMEQAIEEFKKAIELDENNISALINYTLVLIKQGEYEEAESILKDAPVTENLDLKIRSHHLLGIVYMKTARMAEAIKQLELTTTFFEDKPLSSQKSALSRLSVRTVIFHDLSLLYDAAGKKDKALEALYNAFNEALGLSSSSQSEDFTMGKDLMLYE